MQVNLAHKKVHNNKKMDFEILCKDMELALSSNEFGIVNECLKSKDLSLNSIMDGDKDKSKIIRSWIWNDLRIPAETKIILMLKMLDRDIEGYFIYHQSSIFVKVVAMKGLLLILNSHRIFRALSIDSD